MSSLKAIAAVTHTLKSILDESVTNQGIDTLGVEVFTEPLDKLETDLGDSDNALNLYLYMVKENEGWRNQDLSSRNKFGQRITNPYLALDLYYVLSAHGSERTDDHIMLGYAMVALRDNIIIGRDFISTQLATVPILADSGLSEQMEQIKVSLETHSTEEISKLWTMFGAKHRPSAYYKVSVALLQKEKPVRQALPVLQSNLYVQPIKFPTIKTLEAQERVGSDYSNTTLFIEGDTLIIKGHSLEGDVTKVVFDGSQEVGVTVEQDSLISLPIPVELSAGIHSLQVSHELLLGEPAVPHDGVNSNLTAFVLSPVLDNITLSGGNLNADVQPAIEEGKRYTVFLNEINFDTSLRSANEYSFERQDNAEMNSITIPLDEVEAGTYLVRIRVNNATSPIFDDFTGPSITVV